MSKSWTNRQTVSPNCFHLQNTQCHLILTMMPLNFSLKHNQTEEAFTDLLLHKLSWKFHFGSGFHSSLTEGEWKFCLQQYFPLIMWHVTKIWVYFANLKIKSKMMHLNFYGLGWKWPNVPIIGRVGRKVVYLIRTIRRFFSGLPLTLFYVHTSSCWILFEIRGRCH